MWKCRSEISKLVIDEYLIFKKTPRIPIKRYTGLCKKNHKKHDVIKKKVEIKRVKIREIRRII